MKKILPILLLWITGIVLAVFVLQLASCTTTKDVSKSETKTDSTYLKELEEQNRVLSTEVERLTAEVRELQFAEIRFDTIYRAGDTVVKTVIITKDGEIKATGNIVSASVSRNVLTKIVKEKDRLIDSLRAVKQKETIRYITKTEVKEKQVKRSFMGSIWIWLIIGIVIGAVGAWRLIRWMDGMSNAEHLATNQ